MSEKKINGYVIHTKIPLGKGSYGSVLFPLFRSIAEKRTAQKNKWQSRFWKKN
jgi:hypothetical protein